MTDTAQVSDQTEQAEAEQEAPETVALAREMGWKPESEWKGDPPKGGFTSATEYVRRGEKILPIVNARAKKAEARVQELEARLERQEADHRDTIKRIERMSSVALENQRLQITSQYAARKEAAVEVGDKEAYRQADKDEREAIKAIDERLKETDAKDTKDDKDKLRELPREIKEVLDEWYAANPWFNTDKRLNKFATDVHLDLQQEKPGLTLRQNLDEVRKEVVKRFPEKFGEEPDDDDPPRRKGSAVEGGSRLNGAGGGGSKYSKLPADAKANCDRFIKEDGLFLVAGETVEKDIGKARERYAEKYFEEEAS